MRPKTIFWEITGDCNLKCRHCYLGKRRKILQSHLSKDEALNYVDVLHNNGIKTVLLMGGEPLLYPYIDEVITRGGRLVHGMHMAILTNGVLLNEDITERLKRSGVNAVQVSIDSVGGAFQKIRGVDFAVVDQGINELKKNKIRIIAKFTLNRYNLNEFKAVWEYCRKNKIRLTTSLTLGIGRADNNLLPTPDEYFFFIKDLFSMKRGVGENNEAFVSPDFSIDEYVENGIPQTGCGAGRGAAGITQDNDFVPCIYLSGVDSGRLFGLIPPKFSENFVDLFNDHPLFILFRKEAEERFGCPIRRMIHGGSDPYSVYEFAKKY